MSTTNRKLWPAIAGCMLMVGACQSSSSTVLLEGRNLGQVELSDGRVLFANRVPIDTSGESTDGCASFVRTPELGVGEQSCVGSVELLSLDGSINAVGIMNFERNGDTVLVAAFVEPDVQMDFDCELGHAVVPLGEDAPTTALLVGAIDPAACDPEPLLTITSRGDVVAAVPIPTE